MKKSIFFMLAITAFLVSCDKNEKENEQQTPALESTDYSGTLTVEASRGTFELDSTKVTLNVTEKTDSATITMYKVKFSPYMPVTIDVTVPGIFVRLTDKGAVLNCDSIIPLAMGGEYKDYPVTGFEGEIVDDELTFSLKFGSTPTSYQGKKNN